MIRLTPRINSQQQLDDLFRRLPSAMKATVEQTLEAGGQLIANDMRKSIARGTKSGRIYTQYFRTSPTGGVFPIGQRPPHQASAPGEAPASDTGKLVGSIVASNKGAHVIIEARSAYARMLEYGTRKIAPRPFFMPAIERNRARVNELVAAAVRQAAAQFKTK